MSTGLLLTPNLDDGDRFYEHLMALHRDRTEDESAAANARLILLLANHIGDGAILAEAIRLAGEAEAPAPPVTPAAR